MEWLREISLAPIVWAMIGLALAVAEGMTAQLVSIWFTLGAFAAALAALLGGSVTVQLICFLVVSVVTFLVMRPFCRKKLAVKKTATNADSVVGTMGVVLEDVDNMKETGLVRANGLDWTARSVDGSILPRNSQVRVQSIQGVKLMVEAVPHTTTVSS